MNLGVLRLLRPYILTAGFAMSLSMLCGCTPEGLQVFGEDQQPTDLPPSSAQDLLPGVKVESFRALGVVDSVEYYAAVRPGADDPWCLLAVGTEDPIAVCANQFPITLHSENGSVALYNEAPTSGGPWTSVGTSFWSADTP
jgi:hypothetical protein